jgi:TonB family protein
MIARIVVVCMALAVGTNAQEKKDPRKLAGKEATLCGTVVTFMYPGDDCSVRLDLSQPHWRAFFYAEIPVEARAMFQGPPERQFLGQQVCVSGKVARDKKRVPYIAVTSPTQIEQTTTNARPVFAPGTSLVCEKGVVAPKLIKEVRPSYTPDLLRRRLEGVVLLEAVVGVEGTVTDMVVIFADVPDFAGPAQKALREWKFEPGTSDGIPVPVIVQIEMSFKM